MDMLIFVFYSYRLIATLALNVYRFSLSFNMRYASNKIRSIIFSIISYSYNNYDDNHRNNKGS